METEHRLLESLKFAGDRHSPVGLPPLFMVIDKWLDGATDGQVDIAVMPKVGRAACWYALSLGLALARRGFDGRFKKHSPDILEVGDMVSLLRNREEDNL